MKKFLFYTLVNSLLVSCSSHLTYSKQVDQFSTVVQERDGLKLSGYKVEEKKITALFISAKHVGVDEARRNMVGLVRRLNASLRLPEEECFDQENLNLKILFQESDKSFVIEGFIAQVMLKRNKLLFYIWDQKTESLIKVYQEDFDESFGKAYGYQAKEGFRPFSSWESL